jgi:hypothetical protein
MSEMEYMSGIAVRLPWGDCCKDLFDFLQDKFTGVTWNPYCDDTGDIDYIESNSDGVDLIEAESGVYLLISEYKDPHRHINIRFPFGYCCDIGDGEIVLDLDEVQCDINKIKSLVGNDKIPVRFFSFSWYNGVESPATYWNWNDV